jgi:hypothetical protein
MYETPNKECEIQSFAYEEEQAQGRRISKEEMKNIMVHKTMVMMMNYQKKISL